MISAISQNNIQNPSFTSAFGVVHWVAESNGSYAPALSRDLSEKLQSRLVGVLNQEKLPKKWESFKDIRESIKNYLKRCDVSYRKAFFNRSIGVDKKEPLVRSYYDFGAEKSNVFEYLHYLISGVDAKLFNEKFGKTIGKSKKRAKEIFGVARSAETQIASKNYEIGGLNFVKNPSRQVYDENGTQMALHTKFEIKRNKSGKITDYILKDIRFLPAYGENSPIIRYSKGKM